MNILLVSSEVAPFSKTGGLADVAGALPIALHGLGHQVTVITPAYRDIRQAGVAIEPTSICFDIPIGSKVVSGRLLQGRLPSSDVPILFVEQEDYFGRDGLYQTDGADYKDNCERFVFFCRAVMELIRLADIPVDVLHCNDWQTGLIPAYLRIEYELARGYEQIATLMTIHNMAYQGAFWHWDMLLTGLDWKYFNWRQTEFWGHLNLLKTGLVFADAVSTVSPRYAQEIQTEPLGCGLEGVLQQRSDAIFGILNGVDYSIWDPATDGNLPRNYSVDTWQEGKRACKEALQSEVGLPRNPNIPLIGLVGRLADQKGWDLVATVIQRWAQEVDAQWVILGTGQPKYHDLLADLARRYPDRVRACLAFKDHLAHRIEAAADLFLMPSQYEPCGLNQLYSLRYGTVPVVRATGGLADSIQDATSEGLRAGSANGFSFTEYEAAALEETLQRACAICLNQPEIWEQIVTTGMSQDWSWKRSAGEYTRLYERLVAKRQAAVEAANS